MKTYYGVLNKQQMKEFIRHACESLSINSMQEAIEIMEGTCAAETGFCTFKDNYFDEGAGPFQIDKIRYVDIIEYICARKRFVEIFYDLGIPVFDIYELPRNGYDWLNLSPLYSCMIARVGYMMIPERLPTVGDHEDQARYWKKHWNSEKGKGTIEHYLSQRSAFL